jgi:hypothetical protein
LSEVHDSRLARPDCGHHAPRAGKQFGRTTGL